MYLFVQRNVAFHFDYVRFCYRDWCVPPDGLDELCAYADHPDLQTSSPDTVSQLCRIRDACITFYIDAAKNDICTGLPAYIGFVVPVKLILWNNAMKQTRHVGSPGTYGSALMEITHAQAD